MIRTDAARRSGGDGWTMTIVWFIVWLIADNVGAHEGLVLDPVNVWAATLILALGLDLSAAHATRGVSR